MHSKNPIPKEKHCGLPSSLALIALHRSPAPAAHAGSTHLTICLCCPAGTTHFHSTPVSERHEVELGLKGRALLCCRFSWVDVNPGRFWTGSNKLSRATPK